MEEHLCCVHLLGQHTLVWELLPVLMCVLNLWHWSSLPAPAGASQPWLPFTSSLPVSKKPHLVSDLGRVALLHASPLPIHGPFHQLRCLTKKKGKKGQYYRCKDTHHHFLVLRVF